MSDHQARTYGDRIADVYDEWFPHASLQTDASIERLSEFAGSGAVLELGIGTGRVAVPLARRGLEVHGIEASEAMAAKLREKPGGELVRVTVGDIAEADVDGSFSLVFAIGDTLNQLATQEQQRRCLTRFAEKLIDEGFFVVEGIVQAEATPGGSVKVQRVGTDEVILFVSEGAPATQQFRAAHVVLGTDGVRIIPVVGRSIPPAELDLMAELAGLRLRERWGGWEREPFTPRSRRHVSIYGRAESA